MTTLISAATGATTSSPFTVNDRYRNPSAVVASGLTGAETVKLQTTIDGTNWIDVYVNGSLVTLSATNNVIPLDLVGIYRLNKGVTVGAVTVIQRTEIGD